MLLNRSRPREKPKFRPGEGTWSDALFRGSFAPRRDNGSFRVAATLRICENARWHMLSLGPKAALLVGFLLLTILAGIAPSTLDRLEFLNPVATAYGAAQDQAASTAAPGQRFLLLWVVLAALVAGLFAYWLRHKGLENRVKALGKVVEQRETELTEADQKLKRLARLDNVTEIPNHSRFQEFLRDEWRRALREASPLSVIMIDFDHLKEYNDELSHQAGDDCLKKVAKALTGTIGRPGDLLARYGGGEFAVVLSRTDTDGAYRVAHKLCAAVEALAITHPRSPVSAHVTVSLGVASATPALDSNWEELELLATAKRALLQAKEAGRNRVVSSTTAG